MFGLTWLVPDNNFDGLIQLIEKAKQALEHLQEGVRRLFRSLVGTWDFELSPDYWRSPYGDLVDPLLNRRYVVESEQRTTEEIYLLGYDALDDTGICIFFSPTDGPGGSEYLFYMMDVDKAQLGDGYECHTYHFSRHGNRLVGKFAIWEIESQYAVDFDPEESPRIMSGYFLAKRSA